MTDLGTSVSREQACAVHDLVIARFGGAPGIRDEGALDAALAQPHQTFDGEDLYPGIAAKAARYAWGIARNHPFVDGNKRVACAVMASVLRRGGERFKPRHSELVAVMVRVAAGDMTFDELAAWVRRQIVA